MWKWIRWLHVNLVTGFNHFWKVRYNISVDPLSNSFKMCKNDEAIFWFSISQGFSTLIHLIEHFLRIWNSNICHFKIWRSILAIFQLLYLLKGLKFCSLPVTSGSVKVIRKWPRKNVLDIKFAGGFQKINSPYSKVK